MMKINGGINVVTASKYVYIDDKSEMTANEKFEVTSVYALKTIINLISICDKDCVNVKIAS